MCLSIQKKQNHRTIKNHYSWYVEICKFISVFLQRQEWIEFIHLNRQRALSYTFLMYKLPFAVYVVTVSETEKSLSAASCTDSHFLPLDALWKKSALCTTFARKSDPAWRDIQNTAFRRLCGPAGVVTQQKNPSGRGIKNYFHSKWEIETEELDCISESV